MSAATYILPDTLDLASAPTLHRELLAKCGVDLDVDASAVRKLGGLGLQVLLAASASWESRGQNFRVLNRSSQFSEALRLTGSSLPGDMP